MKLENLETTSVVLSNIVIWLKNHSSEVHWASNGFLFSAPVESLLIFLKFKTLSFKFFFFLLLIPSNWEEKVASKNNLIYAQE